MQRQRYLPYTFSFSKSPQQSTFSFKMFDTEKEKETERGRFLINWFSFQVPAKVRLGQPETRSVKLHPVFLHELQGPNVLRYHLLPPRICNIRKLDSRLSRGSNTGTPMRHGTVLTTESNVCHSG